MKLGLIARADDTGLGNQTYQFYRHMKPDRTMVVDISHLNGNINHPERYPDGIFIKGFPHSDDITSFLEGLDVVFVAESPYNYYLYDKAKQMGVKTVVQYNYEFFDWYSHPNLPTPDMLVAPSMWHYQKVQEFAEARGIMHQYLHCPVDRKDLPFVEKQRAKKFLHIAGKPAAFDRNGTESVIDAWEHVRTDAQLYVTVQSGKHLDEWIKRGKGNPKIHFFDTALVDDYTKLFKDMDVMVLPRRYGGNCLPLNEALSTGMPVIMPDVSPNNHLLPPQWLLPAQKVGEFKPRMIVDIYGVNPMRIAEKVDELFNDTKFVHQSRIADAIANQIDWEVMEPMYRDALEAVCQSK